LFGHSTAQSRSQACPNKVYPKIDGQTINPAEDILARVLGNSPDFWLNVQRRSDLWDAMHSPRERERIKRARPLTAAA
jgi:antitoxin HigA-1